jgi:hypothetical protein
LLSVDVAVSIRIFAWQGQPMDDWIRSVVTVGGGRGFVVETEREERLIVTAGHCLPQLPPSHPASRLEERTFAKLIGKLGAKPTVWVECVFVDPVADIAVLSSPDSQALADQAEGYEALMETTMPVAVGSLIIERKRVTLPNRTTALGPPRGESDASLLSLGGQWFACRVKSGGRGLWIDATEPIRSGMSGSPVIAPGGAAIGVVSTGTASNPELAAHLPGWILRDVRRAFSIPR